MYYVDKGICTEDSYAYTAKDGSCKVSSCTKSSFKLTDYSMVDSTVSAIQKACNKQPVSIAVDATNWHLYSSGIFDNCEAKVNHGVLLVGYTSDYWLIRNSWGTSFGEDGYIRIKSGDTCGILTGPSYPKGK